MEKFENFITVKPERNKAEVRARQYELGKILCESEVKFSWPGIDSSAYQRLKNDEEEFPGYATPVDEIIDRCVAEGIKVVTSPNPNKQDVFIVPASSTDIQSDSIFPKHLQISSFMDGDLAELITISRR